MGVRCSAVRWLGLLSAHRRPRRSRQVPRKRSVDAGPARSPRLVNLADNGTTVAALSTAYTVDGDGPLSGLRWRRRQAHRDGERDAKAQGTRPVRHRPAMTLEQQQKFEDEWRGPCPNPRRPNWKPCVRRSSFPLDARALSALPGARFDSVQTPCVSVGRNSSWIR